MMSRKRGEAAERALAALPAPDCSIWSDGSAAGGTSNGGGGAAIILHRENDRRIECLAAAGTHCSSTRAELVAVREALKSLASLPADSLDAIKEIRLCTDSRAWPEVTEPRWPGWSPWGGLSVSLQGVAVDTISHLADLGRTVTGLELYDCTDHTAGSLEPLTRCPGLRELTLSGGVPDTVSLEPLTRCPGLQDLSVTAADLPLLRWQLPEGLERLNVRGPEVTEPRWPEWYWGLSVSLQGVAADTISHLADLGRRVNRLEIYDCHDLTAGSLEPLTRCPGLHWLTLSGGVPDTVSLEPLTRCPELRELTLSGGVPDAVLDSLSGCPGLEYLTLGDRQRPAETAFTAAAVTRLVKSCRELWSLYLHCTADTGRAVLTALKEADLGRNRYGGPRTIRLIVPGELYRQLKSQEGRWIKVWKR
ncbi:hypothetical protein FJT64_003371 [Amphibalanus amphitrite]|uniref:RNase H type-1 domain-containing protein n=1 Tax=Amphibalanus amphitrite TaxID=1232801 RepID=A0A6A4VYL8_AMPAM|nr:hypothetical protein FJT64_003371 [Amphibalanus amphitrite]